MTSPEIEPYQFEYFTSPVERGMLAECGFRVAEYLHEEAIGSLVLVDTAARNMYIPVGDAHEQLYPGEKAYTTYFLNPAGFLSPETHNEDIYTKYVLHKVAEMSDQLTPRETIDLALGNRRFMRRARATARRERIADTIQGGRTDVAAELTPAFQAAVEKDPNFNGRVLVLDGCKHTGAAMEGITNALEDIGVMDVRTGVMNNHEDFSEDPDFVAFADDELPAYTCKPFGPQRGIAKGLGEGQTCTLREGGLTETDRLARKELHLLMKDSSDDREAFSDYVRRRKQPRPSILNLGGALLSFSSSDTNPVSIRQDDSGIIIVEWNGEQSS